MAFVGVTRFSLFQPQSKAWRTSQSDTDSYLAYLYSSERLDPRMKIFEEVTLPLLEVAAENHPIRHIVQFSPELPAKYASRLKELGNQYPFLVVSDVSNIGNTHPHEVAADLVGKQGVYAQYRLDDDDFLSPQYFDNLSRYVAEPFLGFRVSLAAGLTGMFNGESFSTVRYSHRPNIAIGLASIQGHNSNGHWVAPPNGSHHQADRLGPVIVESKQCSYFWTRHSKQDTDFGRSVSFDELKWELELLPPIPSDWDTSEIFPGTTLISSRKSTPLTLNAQVPMQGLTTACNLSGSFSIEVDATYPDGMQSTSALISFEFSEPADNYNWNDAGSGLTKSYYEDIGYFRYIVTYPGRRASEYDFRLPAGAKATAVKIRPFGNGAQPFEVHSLIVKQ